MYPVRWQMHLLPDASLHISAGSWSGHRHVCSVVFGFFFFRPERSRFENQLASAVRLKKSCSFLLFAVKYALK